MRIIGVKCNYFLRVSLYLHNFLWYNEEVVEGLFYGERSINDEGQKSKIKTIIFGENNARADRRHAFSFDAANHS